MPGAKRKTAGPRHTETGGTARERPSLLGFLADQCRARGYRKPGVPTKREGVPPLKKRIADIPTQIREQGVKNFLQLPILYD